MNLDLPANQRYNDLASKKVKEVDHVFCLSVLWSVLFFEFSYV